MNEVVRLTPVKPTPLSRKTTAVRLSEALAAAHREIQRLNLRNSELSIETGPLRVENGNLANELAILKDGLLEADANAAEQGLSPGIWAPSFGTWVKLRTIYGEFGENFSGELS